MSVLLRAEDVPVASRVEYWRHVVGDAVIPMDVHVDNGPDIRNRILAGDMGAVRVSEVYDGPGEACRTRKHIRDGGPDLFQILVQVRGYVLAEQGGRACRLGPGDFGICDMSRPFRCVHSERNAVCVRFPPALLPLPRDRVAQLTGVRIPGDRGTGALVSSLVRELPRHLDDGDADRVRLGAAVLDLLAVALAARLERRDLLPGDVRQRTLYPRIQAFIEERLADPDLSPDTIAAAHHISIRYLYKLFEAEGDGVAGWVRRRRLDRCRRDLLDTTLRGRPVSAIAARWGFTSASHFSRLFRAAYGVSPVEYRALASGSNGEVARQAPRPPAAR